MMYKRSTSTPVRPVAPIIDEPITRYQQPLRPGPISSPSILPFDVGSTIINHKDGSAYQLIQPLGNGSYAVVYMVREKISGKFYALKCLSKANLSDYQLEIQHNEIRVHEPLSHPNIVKLDHYFETSNWLFLVLEYCEGQDLYYWLTQNNDGKDPLTGKLLSDRERITIVSQVFMQILDAVGYCHEKGVAHRDLKPENFIVVVKNDSEFRGVQVKLTDFGLATDEDDSVDFDCGSKPYMSYECRNPTHDTYNPRLADIWSLGIILLNLIYHRSPWTDPNPEECKSFATFQSDKAGFLMERFPDLPKSVAKFFASRVFCSVEEGRVGIKEWRNWCGKLVERMLEEEVELDDVFDDVSQEFTSISRESSSFAQRQRGHDRHQSWSDVVGEFENEPDSISEHSEHKKKSDIEIKIEEQTDFTEKDNIDENQAEIANNSDADSGFEEEEINGNIIKKLKEVRGGEISENSNTTKALSVSPPKIIYCKPKPWGDYKPRGHQRENSIENGSNMTSNNHWSSYNQRRERLEQRRKEKQEQTLNSLGAYRRRGSLNTDTNDTFTPNRPFEHRRRPQRPSNPGQDNIYTTPQRRNAARPHRKRSSQSINELPLVSFPPKASFTSPDPNSTNMIIDSNTSRQRDKTPKKVAKSTKNNLGKMLVGVVMFNRGVKVGGMVNND